MEKPPLASALDPAVAVQRDKVYDWRVEQFERMGFGGPIAHALAGSSADLSKARLMRERGCSYVLMLRILM